MQQNLLAKTSQIINLNTFVVHVAVTRSLDLRVVGLPISIEYIHNTSAAQRLGLQNLSIWNDVYRLMDYQTSVIELCRALLPDLPTGAPIDQCVQLQFEVATAAYEFNSACRDPMRTILQYNDSYITFSDLMQIPNCTLLADTCLGSPWLSESLEALMNFARYRLDDVFQKPGLSKYGISSTGENPVQNSLTLYLPIYAASPVLPRMGAPLPSVNLNQTCNMSARCLLGMGINLTHIIPRHSVCNYKQWLLGQEEGEDTRSTVVSSTVSSSRVAVAQLALLPWPQIAWHALVRV